jgi:hypothetical protein
MNKEYKLDVPKTSKDLLKQPKIAEDEVLPKLNFSMLVVGSSGSGKSVLVFNLITKFYKNFFDMIVLISPTGKTDDIQKALKLPDSRVITDMDKAEEALQKIMDIQSESIKKEGFEHSKKILVYLDDVVGDSKFMNSKAMVNSFIKNRHYNISVILCSQYYKAIPRRMRMQSACNFFFACPETEMTTIAEDFEPPGVGRKRFIEVLQEIMSEKHQFVTIMMRSDWAHRYRKGLAQVIDFKNYQLGHTDADAEDQPPEETTAQQVKRLRVEAEKSEDSERRYKEQRVTHDKRFG